MSAYADIWWKRVQFWKQLFLTYYLKTQFMNILIKKYNYIKIVKKLVSMTCNVFLLALLTVCFHFLFRFQRLGGEMILSQQSPLEYIVFCKLCAHSNETQPP